MSNTTGWQEEADVVVVGYGGAGASAAITAHDAGARVLLLEKQPCDTPGKTNHTPSTRMCGGGWYYPTDVDSARRYMEAMVLKANETLDDERKEMLAIFADYMMTNQEWLVKLGVQPEEQEGGVPAVNPHGAQVSKTSDVRIFMADFPTLPGGDVAAISRPVTAGKFRGGAVLFKNLSNAIQERKISVLWETPGAHLITDGGEVRGVIGIHQGKEIKIKANRGVILTCGGFEFNNWMKENYLRVHPSHFYGNPGNTGDGINMAMEIGAALWHMNAAAWRVTMKFPEFPVAFGTQFHETASVFVDKRGNRFTNERFKMHAFGYELTNYDCYAMSYPRTPSYWLFGEKRRLLGPLASLHGVCNPPGGVMSDINYIWSQDNQKEIERGWIFKASSIEELARQILADADNDGLMDTTTLKATIKRYNELCDKGEDLDFHKSAEFLYPLDEPPYYAVKVWPGGPNTQGGPHRNARGQVLRVDRTPVPRLYSAGELGSVWGMLYQVGGNVAECFAYGRISGAHAAAEKRW